MPCFLALIQGPGLHCYRICYRDTPGGGQSEHMFAYVGRLRTSSVMMISAQDRHIKLAAELLLL